MIPEGTDNHILDSKADAENEDYKYQAKALSAIKKGLEINLTETMNELNYWKQRCEAAEALLLDLENEKQEIADNYRKWQQLKSQTPSPTGDRDCEELKEVEYSVYQLTQKYAEWVEETRGGSIYKFFEWLDFYNLTHK